VHALTKAITNGQDHNKFLKKFEASVQANLPPGEKISLDSIQYSRSGDSCMTVTFASWLDNLNLPNHYIDTTHVKIGNQRIKLCVYCASEADNSVVRPIAIGTMPEESIDTLRTFLDHVIGKVALSLGRDFAAPAPTGEAGERRGRFFLPNLKCFVADGIVGMNALVLELFGHGVVRVSCYFHVFKSTRRWLKSQCFDQKVIAFIETVIHQLASQTNVAEFFTVWDFQCDEMEKMAKGTGLDRSDISLWTNISRFITYFQKTHIQDMDGNRWCRAMIDPNSDAAKISRSTVCESFIRAIKADIREAGALRDIMALESVLAKTVAFATWDKARRREPPVVLEEHVNQGHVLLELVACRVVKATGKPLCLHPRRRYAYRLCAGHFYEIPDEPSVCKAGWKETRNVRGGPVVPVVFMTDYEDLSLKLNGFVIISGEVDSTGQIGRFWYRTARCTCREMIGRCGLPCCHIWALYLGLCKDIDPAIKLLIKREESFKALVSKQMILEVKPKDKNSYY
jgi:hypothetical protein